MEMSDSPSMTETIRRALAVYEHLWEAKKNKAQVLIRDKKGKEVDLLLL